MKKLITLLEKHEFYFDIEELNGAKKWGLTFEKKAYGDSYECTTKSEFGDDYPLLIKLTKEQGIEVADEV